MTQISMYHQLEGASVAQGLVVIIDVFRAFTTACHVVEQGPAALLLVESSDVAARLAADVPRPFLIGKPERDAKLTYDCPSSPTLAASHVLAGRTIIHRSAAGAAGVLRAKSATEVLAASFANAEAVALYVRRCSPAQVSFVCMGHEGVTASLEDELCAHYLLERLRGRAFDLRPHLSALREGPGRYFFDGREWEYPEADFDRCTETNRFSFVLRATRLGDHALLTRLDIAGPSFGV